MTALSIAVHPDDETLGCGGALLKHAAAGEAIHWLIVTAVHEPEFSAQVAETQAKQVELVRNAYPFAGVHWLKLPATRLGSMPLGQIIAAIRDVVGKVRPSTVYVPNRSDAHSDHRVAFDASMAVLKSFYMTGLGVRRVLATEVISETDAAPALAENAFVPNVYVDVSETILRKLEIMSLFASELQTGDMPRTLGAIEALARYRGATVGLAHAEAFMLMREVA
jgi:N-acetylglucosamine malate deacetylase 1